MNFLKLNNFESFAFTPINDQGWDGKGESPTHTHNPEDYGNNNNNGGGGGGGSAPQPVVTTDEFGVTTYDYPPGHDIETITQNPDGTQQVNYSNGNVSTSYPDGTLEEENEFGETLTTHPDGSTTHDTVVIADNGEIGFVTIDVSADGKTVTTTIDGEEQMTVTLEDNGSQTTRFPDGTTTHFEQLTIYDPTFVVTDPHGNQTRFDLSYDPETYEPILTERPPLNSNSDNDQDGVQPNIPQPVNNEPVPSINAQGFPVMTFPEGHTVTTYPGQVIVLQNTDGSGTIMHPVLGEETIPAGSVVSVDAGGNLTVELGDNSTIDFWGNTIEGDHSITLYQNGDRLTVASDGSSVRLNQDGSRVVTNESGHANTYLADNGSIHQFTDGRTILKDGNGLEIFNFPETGVNFTYADGTKLNQATTGSISFHDSEGQSFIFYDNGEVGGQHRFPIVEEGEDFVVRETEGGAQITSYDSGLRVVETEQGDTVIVYNDESMFMQGADGSTTFIGADGSSIHVTADGTEYTNGLETNVGVEPLLAPPHTDLSNHDIPSGEVYDPEAFSFEFDAGEFWSGLNEYNGGEGFQTPAFSEIDVTVAGDSFLRAGFNDLGLSPIMQVAEPVTNQDLESGVTDPAANEFDVAQNRSSGQDFAM